mgnify:CR=1 FL=1
MLKKILDIYEEEEILIVDGFNLAVIGIDEYSMRVIYSVKKCIELLIEQGMDDEEAMEYFTFNVSGSHVGNSTPIWCWDTFI